MSLKNNAGCALLITLFTIVIFSLFSINTQLVTQGNLGKVGTPSPVLVSTLEPSDIKTSFIVENNEVIYGHTYALNCQRVIRGEIKNSNEKQVLNDTVVVIEFFEDSGNIESGHLFPFSDPDTGDLVWSVLLPHYNVYFYVWLQSISTGEVLSPQVPITTYSCENNLAVVNFVQIEPLP